MEYLTQTHQEIVNTLQLANVQVIVNDHPICKTKKFDGYVITNKNPKYKPKRTQLVLCEEVMFTNYQDGPGEVNRTLAHESVHVAQVCKSGDGYIRPLGFRKDIEQESFAIQDQPREVLRILKKYCL
jgi:hypothetical protein